MKDLTVCKRIGRLVIVTAGAEAGSRLSEAFSKHAISLPTLPPASLAAKLASMFSPAPCDGGPCEGQPLFVRSYSSRLVGCGKSYAVAQEAQAHELERLGVPVYASNAHEMLIGKLKGVEANITGPSPPTTNATVHVEEELQEPLTPEEEFWNEEPHEGPVRCCLQQKNTGWFQIGWSDKARLP